MIALNYDPQIRASAAVGIRGQWRFSRGEAAGKLRNCAGTAPPPAPQSFDTRLPHVDSE